VHLVGFTLEICYDAWSYKRQICMKNVEVKGVFYCVYCRLSWQA